jgi:DNA polymerase III epsilon subunit-like protein
VSVRPWQACLLVFKGKFLQEKVELFIDWPDLSLSEEIVKLTGFNKAKYDRLKMPPRQAYEIIKKHIYDPSGIIVGQNLLGYDVYVLASLQRILGEELDFSYIPRILDTRPLGKAVRAGLRKPTNDEFIFWQYKVMHDRSLKQGASQTALLKYFEIPFDPSKLHDAVYDCEKCFEVFLQIKKKLDL